MSHYCGSQNLYKLHFPWEKNAWTLKYAEGEHVPHFDYSTNKTPKSKGLTKNLIAKL